MSFCPKKDWFVKWFDSPYYHLLYSHRDDQEAELFLMNLLSTISIPAGSKILDLACGKGRHAIFLHSKGFQVMGVDLSRESIEIAAKNSTAGLDFEVADMRSLQLAKSFNCVMNLFTSFGYFDDVEDNKKVLKNVAKHLVPGGTFVLDYFNARCVQRHLPAETQVNRAGVNFFIRKFEEEDYVVKEIRIEDEDTRTTYTERVQLLSFSALSNMLEECGFKVKSTFGNYNLSPFSEDESERLIIIAQN